MPPQPIVILGGFLISPQAYEPMRARLEQLSGQPVRLVAVGKPEWLLTVFAFAWARILDRVAGSVAELAAGSPTGRVTLVGHSSGGIMLRLFLDDAPFQGRRYNGKALADTLVMLGSPHTARKATVLRQMVRRRLPGSVFADQVRYCSVAGDLNLHDATPLAWRLAPRPTATAAATPRTGAMAWCRCPRLFWRAPPHWCCRGWPTAAPSGPAGTAARRWWSVGGRSRQRFVLSASNRRRRALSRLPR
ncbi:esterase/lipase family protein [Cyanobium sp. LEGE 06143]|uniref:esterase/lipase family protein n=1 Tax=Cyanobium sp. LEGE 06143 TaxID=945727 RepID=UPI00351C5829